MSQGLIYADNYTCCYAEIEGADQTFYLALFQYTDTGPNSLSADPITPGAWQGIATGVPVFKYVDLEKRCTAKAGNKPRPAAVEADALPLGKRGCLRWSYGFVICLMF